MKSILLCLLLIAAFAQSGCTAFVRTETISPDRATPIPSERIFAFQQQKPGDISLVVTRDHGFMASGCFVGLTIEGSLAARFNSEETATFFVPAGTTQMAVVPDPQAKGLCALGWDPVLENYELKATARNSFRISFGAYRRPRLLPSAF